MVASTQQRHRIRGLRHYVGHCSSVQVDHNLAHGNTVGIEIELSTDIAVADNIATENTIGAVVQLVPGLATTVTDHVDVAGTCSPATSHPTRPPTRANPSIGSPPA